MLFNSMAFAVFLPVVFALHWLLPHKYRWALLLAASYYFYMSWNPKYIVLILGTTAVSWGAGLLLERLSEPKLRKAVVAGALVLCLGVLFFFKYFNFFSDSLVSLLGAFSLKLSPVTLKVLLPVGISFYTFQTLSYVLDVYRGRVKAEHHFGVYAAFISFFPQLVAGPIERTENLLPQIREPRVFRYDQAAAGMKLMAWGFFKKLAVADVLGQQVDLVYSSLSGATSLDLLAAMVFFSFQIYCDFSGYSDIAVGAAKLMGIDLMANFRSPYFASSIRDFWAGWHISLSTWFRDYVYIPMGGSRCSRWKQGRNLMATFLLSGLWHGASWTYVFWGGLHGLAHWLEKLLGLAKPGKDPLLRALRCCGVFVFCCITWVFFRAETISDAFRILSSLTGQLQFSVLQISGFLWIRIALVLSLLAVYDYASLRMDVTAAVSRLPAVIRWGIYLALVWLILACMPTQGQTQFVYFRF